MEIPCRFRIAAVRALMPVAALLVFLATLTLTSNAHLGMWKPPKKFPDGSAAIGKPAQPGGAVTKPGSVPLSMPSGGNTGGGGARTKKSAGATSPVSWEDWWARNRFRYLEFPGILEKARMFPQTPEKNGTREMILKMRADSLTLIRPLLDDKSARLRRAALIGLARLDDLDSLPGILELLRDGNQTVRDSALLALGIMESKEAKHTLLHVARGTETACTAVKQSAIPDYFRGFAEVSLAMDRTQGIGTILQCIASDPSASSEVKAMALEGIGLLGGDEGSKFLMDFIDAPEPSPRLVAMAAAALGKTDDPAAIPCLERCLLSRHTPVRQSAALALGRLAGEGNTALLKRLYQCFRHSGDQALKGFSLVSMGRIGGLEAVQYLDQVLNMGTATELPWACLGLGLALREAEDEILVKRLMDEALSSASRSTRGAAAIALGLIRCREAVDSLVRMLREGDDPIYRGYCAMALGMIGDPAAIEPLRRSLREDELPQVRTQATLALALLNDTAAAPELVELLIGSNNDSTKGFIALSLAFMGDMKIVGRILEGVGDRELDDLTRLYLIEIASKLLSGRTSPYLERIAEDSNFASEYPLVSYLLDFGI